MPLSPGPDSVPTSTTAQQAPPTATRTGTAAPKPAANTYYEFAIDVLKGLGDPVTPANVGFILAWAKREGGGGSWNPLNTTLKYGRSTDLTGNSAHVKNYASFKDGVTATVKTLRSSLYKDVRNAFSTGHADPNANYAGLSTWSGGGYESLSGTNGADWAHHTVAGSGGGGAGGTGAGAPAAAPPATKLSPAALNAGLSKDGFAIGLIDSNAELKRIVTNALKNNSSVDETVLALQNSNWFRTHSQAQQQYLEMKYSSPDQLKRKVAQTAHDLTQMATQLGIPIADVNALANSVVYNGMDQVEQTAALVKGFHYTGQSLTGQSGADVDSLKQFASQYDVGMSNKQYQSMIDRMLNGQLNPTDMQDYFKTQALSKYPHLKKQLDAGLTIADVASPYKQEMAKLWNDDQDTAANIATSDPTIQKALQQSTPDGTQLMPVWQFQQTLKQDPRWLKTNNARDSLMDTTTSLLQNMGLMAGGVNMGVRA